MFFRKILRSLFYFSRESRYRRQYRELKINNETPSSYIWRNADIHLMIIVSEPSGHGEKWLLSDGTAVRTNELIDGIHDAKFNYRYPPF